MQADGHPPFYSLPGAGCLPRAPSCPYLAQDREQALGILLPVSCPSQEAGFGQGTPVGMPGLPEEAGHGCGFAAVVPGGGKETVKIVGPLRFLFKNAQI